MLLLTATVTMVTETRYRKRQLLATSEQHRKVIAAYLNNELSNIKLTHWSIFKSEKNIVGGKKS